MKVERLHCYCIPSSVLSVTPVHAERWDEELMVFMGIPGLREGEEVFTSSVNQRDWKE